jgi:hypothetical protein
MANTVKAFGFDLGGPMGPYIIARRESLTAGMLSPEEVDANVELLKADLDAVAKDVKAEIRERAKRPI